MKLFILPALMLLLTPALAAQNTLLFLEAQGVAGYSSKEDKIVFDSSGEYEAMQKNSVGFDLIQKFSSDYGDIATLYVQARVAYNNKEEDKFRLQLYNAYLNFRLPQGFVWVGHNRPAFGLASYFDTHGALLQTLSMYGFGFDRDWGAGYSKDTQDGDIKISFTSGTGMPLYTYGNWLAAARISKGILNYDNYNAGLSFKGGRELDIMGYHVMDRDPKEVILGGIDFAFNHDSFEHKAELAAGSKHYESAFAALYRFSFNLLEEQKLKLEAQGVYTKEMGNDDNALAWGTSYKYNTYLTLRLMQEYRHKADDMRVITQAYYYFPI